MSVTDYESCQVAADSLREVGFDEFANVLESREMKWIGQYIAIYGPNYIFTGKLAGVTPDCLYLDDVWEVFTTGEHRVESFEGEFFSESQSFSRCAVCNCGPTPWAAYRG